MSEFDDVDLGILIANAADADDAAVAASIIRGGDFIVLKQIDVDSVETESAEEGSFSVVLAEMEGNENAVVCFSNRDFVAQFVDEIADHIPLGSELPAVKLDGDSLLDGLPSDCGLLLNPGIETECYFPPGCLEFGGHDDE